MKQRKFSKTGLVLVGSMLVCLLICLAVVIPKGGFGGDTAEDLNDENTPDLKTVMSEGSPLLIYDKRPEAQALIAAYEAGDLEKVVIRGRTEFEADTPSEVKELYRQLKNVVVTEEAPAAAVEQTLEAEVEAGMLSLDFITEDGTECIYTLIGDSILAIGDVKNNEEARDADVVSVTGTGPLLKKIKDLK